MYLRNNQTADGGPRACARHVLNVHSGIPALELLLRRQVEALGMRFDRNASTMLLIDLPFGFALQTLPLLEHSPAQVIVLTENRCPEYWEDLWDYGPAALVVGLQIDQALADTVASVGCRERLRVTPPTLSSLTAAERAVLRQLAYGQDNHRIASHLQLREKTVRNTLTNIYDKLGLTSRVQAALYYWGRGELSQ